jgi:hypothetical protein
MKRGIPILGCVVLLFVTDCASSRAPSSPADRPALVSPADFVASLADVANGRNPDTAEAGLVLKQIELKLVVGRERRGGGRASILLLDAEASRRTEVSFAQTFTLELPPPERRRSAAPSVAVPGVVDFVEAAMASARELAEAAARAGIPQKLREVELVAKIVRSDRVEGGLAFTFFTGTSLSAGIGRISDEANTVRLVFVAR